MPVSADLSQLRALATRLETLGNSATPSTMTEETTHSSGTAWPNKTHATPHNVGGTAKQKTRSRLSRLHRFTSRAHKF